MIYKKVNGMTYNDKTNEIIRQPIDVRYTADQLGKTLSLATKDFQITIQFDEMYKIITKK